MDDLIERLAWEVCNGKKTLLQVERHLLKTGWNVAGASYLMKRISDKVSERKKGNG